MTAYLTLVRTQLRLYLQNRRAVAVHLLAPILIAAFFGTLFGGSGGGESRAPITLAVVDEDASVMSRGIVQRLQADAALQLAPMSREQAEAAVRQGAQQAALVLPAGFGEAASRAWVGGRAPQVLLWVDPSKAVAGDVVRGLFQQAAMTQLFTQAGDVPLREEDLVHTAPEIQPHLRGLLRELSGLRAAAASAGGEAAHIPAAFTLEVQPLSSGEQGYNGYAHSFAGMGVQFVLMLGIELGIGLLLVRQSGLWQRLRAAPLSKATLLGAHFTATTLIASCVLLVVLGVGMAVFGVRITGSAAGVGMIAVSFAAFTAGFGLLLAAVGGTPEATRGLAILAALLLVMLGGAWVPSFVFPAWMQQVTLFIPVRWAVDGLDAMLWRGQPLATALLPCVILLTSGAVLSALAVWRFRWRLG